MNGIRLITVDLDDTLWPIAPVIEGAEHRLHEWFSRHAPRVAERFTPLQLRALRNEAESVYPQLAGDITALRKASIRLALLRAEEPEHLADDAFEIFWESRNCVEFFPDALPALERLGRHFRLASLSNGNADVRRLGLDGVFEFSISARECGYMKPHRLIFERACETAKLRPEQVLHVGDDLACDVKGALACGMQAAWINRDEPRLQAPLPALTLPDLGALADRLTPAVAC